MAMKIFWCVCLLPLGACASTKTFQMDLQPTYVATPMADGSLQIALTATGPAPKVSGGASIPLNEMFANASKKECPNGYAVLHQDYPTTHTKAGVFTASMTGVVRCN